MNATRHAEIYGVNTTQISRWKAVGLRAGFPCPLDFPEKMPEWWERCRQAGEWTKSCPTKILVAAGKVQAVINSNSGAESTPMDFSKQATKSRGYAETLELAERNVTAVQVIFDQALLDGNDTVLIGLQKTLNDAVDSHRALMRDRGKIQAEAGETLPKHEVRSSLLELHANIARQFRQGIKAAFTSIETATESREQWGVFADELVDRICTKLSESKFAAE
jgi:hypothetical protein